MKKIISFLCFMVLILSLAGCGPEPQFNGSRTGNDSQFIMQYTVFNTTDSQELELQAGDSIRTRIESESGSISIVIKQEGKDPIYQGNDITLSSEFTVKAEEAGRYRVSVTGKKAKGSVSFVVEGK